MSDDTDDFETAADEPSDSPTVENSGIEPSTESGAWIDNLSSFADWTGATLQKILLPTIRKNVGRALDAMTSVYVAKKEAEIAEINATSKENVNFIETVGETARQTALSNPEFYNRAFTHHSKRIFKEQRNRESVATKGLRLLAAQPPKTDSRKEINQDWLDRFAKHVETVNDDLMQGLWAVVLAGEIKSPGSFSLRSLETLALTSHEEATLFVKISGYVITIGRDSMIPYYPSECPLVISQQEMLLLVDANLVREIAPRAFTPPTATDNKIYFQNCEYVYRFQIKKLMPVDMLALTKTGQQLLLLAKPTHNKENLKLFFHVAGGRDSSPERAKLEGLCQYHALQHCKWEPYQM